MSNHQREKRYVEFVKTLPKVGQECWAAGPGLGRGNGRSSNGLALSCQLVLWLMADSETKEK